MKTRCFLFVASAFFLILTAGRLSATAPTDPVDWTLSQWVAWRDRSIDAILSPTWSADGKRILSREDVILRCVDAYREVSGALEQPGFLDGKPELTAKVGHFYSFVKAQATMARYDAAGNYNYSLGFDVSNVGYWSLASRDLAIPPLLKDGRFLDDLASPATYSVAGRMIDEHNRSLPETEKWIYLFYRSGFLKSVDGVTYGRLLVYVPNIRTPDGQSGDLWVQFGILTPEDSRSRPAKTVSAISVSRSEPKATHSTAYLSDFYRLQDSSTRNWEVTPTMLLPTNPSKNCYDCHKTPVLPIHPKATYAFGKKGDLTLDDKNNPTAQVLNDIIAGYGKVTLNDVPAFAYGPGFGPDRGRSDDRIRELAGVLKMSTDSVNRLKSAMKCNSCHHEFAPINYPQCVTTNINTLHFEQKKPLVQSYIENGWMPPGNDLSPAERKQLWTCLSREYLRVGEHDPPTGTFVDWLKGR